ncbi:MAG: hypothetical protein OXI43_21895 [Candidatus Poribacteria bacterium]|nr:hypothetical protein [Candidatus Poribacteria bacterium]
MYTGKSQGEIDVVGLNLVEQRVYICEVAIHIGGLQYVNSKSNRTDNIQKFTNKFSKDIEYAQKHLDGYDQHFMLWSPIVKDSKGKPKNNEMRHLTEIQKNIKRKYGIIIECIVNEKFQECLDELRNYAKHETKALQCPLMRLMQIEEYLNKHVLKLTNLHQLNGNVARSAIHKQKVGYSEFWAPIREGKLGGLFVGKPVPLRNDRSIRKNIRNTGVELYIINQRCCIRLHFKDADHRKKIMTLFPKSDYTWEYKDSPKEVKVIFPVLDKGKNDRDDWDEIREKLVGMGTDIYNKIKESGDNVF